MIRRLARSSYLHPWRTLGVWLVGVTLILAAAASLGSAFGGSGRLPGADSQAAYDLLSAELPSSGAETARVVVQTSEGTAGGLDNPATAASVDTFLGEVGVAALGGEVSGPIVSDDGRTAMYFVEMPDAEMETADGELVAIEVADDLQAAAQPARDAGLTVEFGGWWFVDGDVPASSEWVGIVVAVVVLLMLFGSLVAVGVTLLPALLAVAASGGLVLLVSHVITTPDITTTVATMIGLGVGIDYALVIIARFRRELAVREPLDALSVAMGTAGHAVVLAGSTVVVSLLGMLLIRLEFLKGLAIGASVAVLVSILAALTLMPALLRFSTGRLARKAKRLAARPARETAWHRWGRFVADRPWTVLTVGLVTLLLLAAPVLSMRLAAADEGNTPLGSTTRSAYDITASEFGPGVNGPLVLAVADATPTSVETLTDALLATDGVATVLEPALSSDGRTAALTVIPTDSPQSTRTEDLVHRLRGDVIPSTGVTAYVGGATASNIDFSEVLRQRLPLFIAAVLVCSFLLLMVVFRSILVPLKAVLLNVLSISAAFGATVAVFQWGWLSGVFGTHGGAPIEPWAPMLMFAIVFGLSMDYEVFLLSAVKENYDRTGDNREAVVEGLSSTAKLITGAAAIMVAVFGSFLSADLRDVQLVGFGLAVAVLIDATVVRTLLVPASMELLGDRNWWFPRRLGALVPHVQVETMSDDPIRGDSGLDGARLDDMNVGTPSHLEVPGPRPSTASIVVDEASVVEVGR